MQLSDRHVGKNAALEGAIDSEVLLRRVTIGIGASNPEKDRAMENQDERQEQQQDTPGPAPPGAARFAEGVAIFVHAGANLFPRGKEQPGAFVAPINVR